MREETAAFSTEPAPNEWNGVKIVVDPDLPETEFDVVFTVEMWARRLSDLAK